jgi:hypothetical protein
VVAIAPELTMGLVVRSARSSTAMTELKGCPVASTPSRRSASSGPSASHTSANTNGLDTLWIEKAWSASPTAKDSPRVLATQMPKCAGSAAASAGM